MNINTLNIDIIANVLKSQVAVGRYRGEEVGDFLFEHYSKIENDMIFTIDIRKANPLQYNFCQYAFGPIVKSLQDCKVPKIPVIFHMQEHHKGCFFRGILKFIDKNLPRSESLNAFMDFGMFTMIKIENKNEIHFISKTNNIEKTILELINEKRSISGRDIIEIMKSFEPEDIIDALRSLNNKGFVIHNSNSDDHYYSLYNYLN